LARCRFRLRSKVAGFDFGDTVRSRLVQAITELQHRDYTAELRAAGAADVFQYAMVFDRKRCWVRSVEG